MHQHQSFHIVVTHTCDITSKDWSFNYTQFDCHHFIKHLSPIKSSPTVKIDFGSNFRYICKVDFRNEVKMST